MTFGRRFAHVFRTVSVRFGSRFGSGRQNIVTRSSQGGNIIVQRIPHRGNVDRTVGVDIEISGVLYDTPRNGRVLPLDLIGELGNQFPDLNNAHTAGILKEIIALKSCKIMVIPLQIIRDTLSVHNDFLKDDSITHFDKAAPRLS